jgi:predicted outer membrane repeat protein/parallel beta-helix repeat protein
METNGDIKIIFFISVILITCGFSVPSSAGIIFVDDDATGANDGSSWADAYNFLQDALAVASATDVIKVAQGIYKPDLGGGNTAGDKQATFQLINGVTIEGGYAGVFESQPNNRNVAKYETILSGDLNGDDGPDFENNSNNSCHIVTGSFTGQTAVLDGFTIKAGNGSFCDDNPRGGAGVRIESGSPAIQNCLFTGNMASDCVLLNYNGSNPVLINCMFSNNSRTSTGIENIASSPIVGFCIFENLRYGMENRDNSNLMLDNCVFRNSEFSGYGMYNRNSNLTLTNCTFENNERGGMDNRDSNLTLNNCIFRDNLDNAINHRNGSLICADCLFSNNSGFTSGGIDCSYAELILYNCIFEGNSAIASGGAISCRSSTLNLNNCSFVGNTAGLGGGISSGMRSTLNLNNCTFSGNSANAWGGGLDISSDITNIQNCKFIGNSARSMGGGIYCSGDLKLELCTFSGNQAERGGGIHSRGDYELSNCIFEGNVATDHGGGICLSSGVYQMFSNCTFYGNRGEKSAISNSGGSERIYLEGCILWNNDPDPIDDAVNVTYSNVQGGWPGEGNIDVDPLFVAPGYWADANDLSVVVEPERPDAVWMEGDYHLQSQAGHWDSQSQSWIQDQATSPCVDAGNPMAPICLEPFPNGAIFNMGAYGRSVEASKTYFGSPVCDIIIPGDINGDCIVDFKDLEIVVLNWMIKGEDFVNSPPTVTLLEPQDGAQVVRQGSTIFLAEADDPDGEVVCVNFNIEQRTENSVHNIGLPDPDGSNGWEREYTWRSGDRYGSWTVWAEATDDKGAVGVSSKITITLIEP